MADVPSKDIQRAAIGLAAWGALLGLAATFFLILLPKNPSQVVVIVVAVVILGIPLFASRIRHYWAVILSAGVVVAGLLLLAAWCAAWNSGELTSEFGAPLLFLYWSIGSALVAWHFISLPLKWFKRANGKRFATVIVGVLTISSTAAGLARADNLAGGYERYVVALAYAESGTPTIADGVEVVYTCDSGAKIIPLRGEPPYQYAAVPFYCNKETLTVILDSKYAIARGAEPSSLLRSESTTDVTTDSGVRWITTVRTIVTYGLVLPHREWGTLHLYSGERLLAWDF